MRRMGKKLKGVRVCSRGLVFAEGGGAVGAGACLSWPSPATPCDSPVMFYSWCDLGPAEYRTNCRAAHARLNSWRR
ncbi:hypothetical protein EVAR_22110_1 [Eumeta japonica]|uniref:Uncharacterized protein n=1 Tax=Eumeta variegata TaxID=151549 RepID=A0A4C1VY72_EUMVA|nr:hypothetical protein EVAR_22110_1 [Eumeta japonica]